MKRTTTAIIVAAVLMTWGAGEAAGEPVVTFVGATPEDGVTVEGTSTEIEASIIESALVDVTFNWNGTDYVIYDDSTVLMFNFDYVTALGENYGVPGGLVKDLSNWENDGTLGIGSDPDTVPEWLEVGRYGGAFDFAGNGSTYGHSILVEVPDDSSLNPGGGDFAIAVWVRPRDDIDGDIIRKGSTLTASTWYKLEHSPSPSNNKFSLNFKTDGTDATVTSSQAFNDDLWHFVVAQRRGNTAELWIDASLVGSASVSGSISNTANLTIGSKDTQDDDFINATLDEVRLYRRSFAEDQMQMLYHSNLSRADLGTWYLYVNQTNLAGGTYAYQVSATNALLETGSAARSVTMDAPHDPEQPTLVGPEDGANNVSASPTLQVTVSDIDGEPLDVSFFGRELASSGEEFTIIALPDTQKYVLNGAYPEIFTAQTQWIIDNKDALNIVFVTHEGDIVDTWNSTTQWDYANASMSLLDGVVPYSVVPGDHDHYGEDPAGSTEYYELYFPASRFSGYPWWGGSYAGNYGGNYDETYPHTNNNNYQLLTIGGQDYIFVSLDFCPSQDEIDWANGILTAYSERMAILTTHALLDTNANYYGSGDFWLYPDGSSNPTGDTSHIWYDLIRNHENLQLVLCGHMHGEARRTDDNLAGKPVHQLLANYQSRTSGGNGWLRIMRFVPAADTVYVQTYSPWLDQYETDADSEFSLYLPMSGGPFLPIGTDYDVPSGQNASIVWDGLSSGTNHEWFVEVTDPTERTTVGPVWSFATALSPEASNPNPPNGATEVAIEADLSWSPGIDAVSHDVYFGTDSADLPLLSEQQVGTTYDPGMLDPSTTYYWAIDERDSGGTVTRGHVWSFTTVPCLASSDVPVAGTVAGTYATTHAGDNSYQTITEIKSQGKPPKLSYLEHKWTIDVPSGTKESMTFSVEAFCSDNSEGDTFDFAYSTDNVSYTDMLTVTKTADDDTSQSFALPVTLSGAVYIRVTDTDRTANATSLDTVYVDRMHIQYVPGPPSYGVTVTIDEASQTVQPGAGTTYDVRVVNSGGLDASYAVAMSGTAIDDTTIVVTPLTWPTALLAPGEEEIGSVTVSTGESTPERTYTLTATATCDQDGSVSDAATSELVVSSQTNVLHIESVVVTLNERRAGKNTFISGAARVTVVDVATGQPIEGATVYGYWSGATTDIDSGVTDTDGVIALYSDELKNPASGTTFTFTADNVEKLGWSWDGVPNSGSCPP